METAEPSVFYHPVRKEFWMYYKGRDAEKEVGRIGLATSKDGKIWSKHSKNPVFSPGSVTDWDRNFLLLSLHGLSSSHKKDNLKVTVQTLYHST